MAEAKHNGLVTFLSRRSLWAGRPTFADGEAYKRSEFNDLRDEMYATVVVSTDSTNTHIDIRLTPVEVETINRLEADIVTRLSNEIIGKC